MPLHLHKLYIYIHTLKPIMYTLVTRIDTCKYNAADYTHTQLRTANANSLIIIPIDDNLILRYIPTHATRAIHLLYTQGNTRRSPRREYSCPSFFFFSRRWHRSYLAFFHSRHSSFLLYILPKFTRERRRWYSRDCREVRYTMRLYIISTTIGLRNWLWRESARALEKHRKSAPPARNL